MPSQSRLFAAWKNFSTLSRLPAFAISAHCSHPGLIAPERMWTQTEREGFARQLSSLPRFIVSPTPGLAASPPLRATLAPHFARRFTSMTEHAVVIAGGGPTGLMLAGELA